MAYKIRYTNKEGKGAYLKSATGRTRTFTIKKNALRVAKIYDHKKNIRVIKKS